MNSARLRRKSLTEFGSIEQNLSNGLLRQDFFGKEEFEPDIIHNPDEMKRELKERGIAIDSRSNGPAIMSFLLAGGKRPKRADSTKGWAIHHIYNGKFPFTRGGKTLHAVKDGNHFTQSAGLVAIHPIAHALADEYFHFVWLLRHESFLRFNYDPDRVFCKKIDEYGFKISRARTK